MATFYSKHLPRLYLCSTTVCDPVFSIWFWSHQGNDSRQAFLECCEFKAHGNAHKGIYQLSSDSANTSYLFRNLKHRLCLVSVTLGSLVNCLGGGLVRDSFSIAFMNFRRCLMYSGYVSRLQCPPPFTHNGSYFSLASSHNRFPWDKSTISSFVPCKSIT